MSDPVLMMHNAVAVLLDERNAVLKRAEAAEAEVSRLKALLEAKQPAEAPAAPRVLPSDYADASAVAKHGEWLSAAMAVEAPAKPEVLPEHLAFLEASAAAWVKDREGEIYGAAKISADEAASALVAAVARRDGGAK